MWNSNRDVRDFEPAKCTGFKFSNAATEPPCLPPNNVFYHPKMCSRRNNVERGRVERTTSSLIVQNVLKADNSEGWEDLASLLPVICVEKHHAVASLLPDDAANYPPVRTRCVLRTKNDYNTFRM